MELRDGAGLTCNVSESGVLFETEVPVVVGESIDFSIVFGELDPAYRQRVRCIGEVVRLEERGGARGVAVKLVSYGL